MVKTTEPKIEQREAQPYAGIRTQVSAGELDSGIIPQLHDEVMTWLKDRGIDPVGAPFMRYYVINMDGKLDIEMGWPIAERAEGDSRVNVDVIPAGRYASLVYTDINKGIEGNRMLIEWAKSNGFKWDRWDDPNGDAFRSRIEIFITDPDDEPDMAKWETEVAIKLADNSN